MALWLRNLVDEATAVFLDTIPCPLLQLLLFLSCYANPLHKPTRHICLNMADWLAVKDFIMLQALRSCISTNHYALCMLGVVRHVAQEVDNADGTFDLSEMMLQPPGLLH
eukprot:355066-Chlamydomonas_euryale.AAC.17